MDFENKKAQIIKFTELIGLFNFENYVIKWTHVYNILNIIPYLKFFKFVFIIKYDIYQYNNDCMLNKL